MPNWLGDLVMAMPTLRALRTLYPGAEITALLKRPMRPLLEPCPWVDRVITPRHRKGGRRREDRGTGLAGLARKLAGGRFDTALLLANSFRSALLVRLAGIPRRVGYARDGRGALLTDGLLPRRSVGGRYLPTPARDYYLGLARYLGAPEPDRALTLFTRPEIDAQVKARFRAAGHDPEAGPGLAILVPGANYGDAKMWYPERFAREADRMAGALGLRVAVSGSPAERAILAEVIEAARAEVLDLPRLGFTLRELKSAVRLASIVVSNDTGPRHVAAALGVPVVTLFGPTDPAWTEIGFPLERQVRVDVFCGPCQKKHCPLDHRCMQRIEPEMVMEPVVELLEAARLSRGVPGTAPATPGGRARRAR